MNTRSTTAQCSYAEKEHIREIAHSRGYDMCAFVSHAVDKHLPLNHINVFDKSIPRMQTVCIKLNKELDERLLANIKKLSTDYVSVKLFEIVLTCVDLECGK